MANPASVADLESRWRALSSAEAVNGDTFLADAWQMLKRRVSGLEALIATDADLRADAVRILATAVLRVMKNPDGKRQESIDDYSWTRDQSIAAGLLYFTDDELGALLPDGSRGAFSLDLLGSGYPDARFPA